MRLHEFLVSPDRRSIGAAPEADALRDDGALEDAALFDLRFDTVRSELWLLFDCRGALRVRAGNTAVLVLKAVQRVRWEDKSAIFPHMWRSVDNWVVRPLDRGSFELNTDFFKKASLHAVFSSGEFFVGDVPGCDEAPPNFLTATDHEIRTELQGWNSTFSPIHGSFLD